MTNKINSIKLLTLLLLSTVICAELFASEVNVYSGRKEKLIKPLLDEFSKETGVKVNLVTAKSSALLKRLELEKIFETNDVNSLRALEFNFSLKTDTPPKLDNLPKNGEK